MIAVVTDSTAYLTKQESYDFGVRMVPMSYSVSGKTFSEDFSDQNGDFESLIFRYASQCTTSQPPRSAFTNLFEQLIRQGYDVVCIVISSRLSGTYSSASMAAKEVSSEKISVIDSLSTAGGLSILVKKAKEFANKGYSLQEVTDEVKKLRYKIGISFSVDNMDALRRSGRLGIVRQSVGTILNIRPILICKDGAIIAHASARGKSEQIKYLVGTIPENAKEIIIHYLGSPHNADMLYSATKIKFPDAQIKTAKLGPVLSIHLGLGITGISWLSE